MCIFVCIFVYNLKLNKMELKEDNTSILDAELKTQLDLNKDLKTFLIKVKELKADTSAETIVDLIKESNEIIKIYKQ